MTRLSKAKRPSPGQASIFGDDRAYSVVPENFTADDWETPDPLARAIAGLVLPTDKVIIEPAAGRGNIARYLPDFTYCIEPKKIRYEEGLKLGHNWVRGDYLQWIKTMQAPKKADLIIGNPPFSLVCEFLGASQHLIKDGGRIAFLLPTDCFQPKNRADRFAQNELVISQLKMCRGRVNYEQEKVIEEGRQCSDSIYIFEHRSQAIANIDILRW